jgi:hypothetical protein
MFAARTAAATSPIGSFTVLLSPVASAECSRRGRRRVLPLPPSREPGRDEAPRSTFHTKRISRKGGARPAPHSATAPPAGLVRFGQVMCVSVAGRLAGALPPSWGSLLCAVPLEVGAQIGGDEARPFTDADAREFSGSNQRIDAAS